MSSRSDLVYPKGEHVWVGYYTKDRNLLFIMTSKESRDFYYLYERIDGNFKKLGRAKSPQELEEKFEVDKRLGV